MKRFAWLAVLMLFAGTAFGQSSGTWGAANRTPNQTATNPQGTLKVMVVGGVNASDTSFVPLQFDASGNLRFAEASPLGGQTSGWITLAAGTGADTTAVGTADSSQVNTQYTGYVLHGIYIRASLPANGASATNAFCRVAIQIRTHVNGLADSINTAPVMLVRSSGVANDSTAFGRATQKSSVQQGDDEFVVVLTRQSQNGAANGFCSEFARYIPLEYGAAPGVRLPNFSVRWRVLSATANTNTFWISAYATVLR